MQDAAAVYYEAWDEGLKPDEKISLVEWSDTYRFLPQVASKEHGRYSTARTPYVREIMEKLSPDNPTKDIVFMKSAQIGGTEIGVCWFGYVVHKSPGPMLQILPTIDLARDYSKQKLQPTISETPVLAERVRESKARDSGNTILTKGFPGGILFLGGSNSPAGFRSRSIRFLFLDDVDGYETDVGGEGDPVDLAKKRTNTYFANKKVFEVSTPTVKGLSRIERSFLESDQRFYEVPCPHCGAYQRLIWGGTGFDYGIKFERDKEGVVVACWYVCRECRGRIEENEKTRMLDAGKWIATKPGREKVGFQISALYSPLGWVSWREIAKEFLAVKRNAERLKTWTNTVLGETFEEKGSQPDWALLKARSEPYRVLEVPSGGLLLAAGVDVQANRLAVVIKAFGEGEESWLVYWVELYGDPTSAGVWNQLDELINRSFKHESGVEIPLSAVAVDAGYKTQEVLNYCRLRAPRLMATKGSSKAAQPVLGKPTWQDVSYEGQKFPSGAQLWPIGTDTAKTTIYSRLNLEAPGPGYFHFPIGVEDAYFQQLTAEKLTTKYLRGYPKPEWTKIRERNEALDCFDDKTEVLTENGWRFFANLKGNDHLATVNLNTDTIEYQTPLCLIKKEYKGEMIAFNSGRLNIKVTPTHRMVINRVKSVNGKKTWDGPDDILLAKDMKPHMAIKMRSNWRGIENKTIRIGSNKVDSIDFASFCGWYVAEGHTFKAKTKSQKKQDYRVIISQHPGGKADEIARLLNRLPWKWYLSQRRQFIIRSKALYSFMQNCGKGVKNKKAPNWIKKSNPHIINAFLDSAIAGDGWTDNYKHRTYTTVSYQLANDIQELFIKIGRWGIIRERKPESFTPGFIRGKLVIAKLTQFNVSEIRTKRAYLYGKNRQSCISTAPYDGLVYCATIPNGTLICRRNGKSFIAGNCEVLAYAAAIRAGLIHTDWEALRKSIGQPKTAPARKPRSSGWVKKSGGGSWIQRR